MKKNEFTLQVEASKLNDKLNYLLKKDYKIISVTLLPNNKYNIIYDKINDSYVTNQDIIDFRYKLIDWSLGDRYLVSNIFCNDGRNDMTDEKRKVLEDVLLAFNMHFTRRNYNTG